MYLAHKSDFEKYSFRPLRFYNNRVALVNNLGKFYKVSNVCPHQGAQICSHPSNDFTCPYHGLSWDVNGKPTNSSNTYELEPQPVYSYSNLLLDNPCDISHIPLLDRPYTLMNERVDKVNASYITIMDVFLDVDHIPHAHANVYDRIMSNEDVKNIDYSYESWGSVQLVSNKTNKNNNTVSAWIAMYPNTMIELQPYSMIITQAYKDHENGNKSMVTVNQYKLTDCSDTDYREDIAMWETAWIQDKALAECIINHVPENLEYSKKHFRRYLELNGLFG